MRTNLIRNALITIGLVAISACATLDLDLPAVTDAPVGERTPGKIIWRDLLTNDSAASQRFYGELFGWQFEAVGNESGFGDDSTYTLIRHEGELIGGMVDTVALNGRDDISQWVVVMSVANVETAAAAVKDMGGEVVTPPTDLRRRGTMALVRDAEGALLALLETRDGDPGDREPRIDGFLWDELWTENVADASDFYGRLAGLEIADREFPVASEAITSYRILESQGLPRVGILPNPIEALGPVWVSYLRVEDPAAVAAQVADFGGRVIVEAHVRPMGAEVAFIAGPSGAGIALQTWPLQ